MALLTKAPRGTQDVLPQDSYKWHLIEQRILEIARLHGFREIRFPTFEHTELFVRSVGDSTDVVEKEMYTFEDKAGRSITLRPEGTAGTARCVLEHALLQGGVPLSVCYLTSCFRYEKPQAGRLREFHQFGAELFGSSSPLADAQLIALASAIFSGLSIANISLEINSIGCPNCRPQYHKALKEYFRAHESQLCDTCRSRLDRNPLRILDCKSPVCSEIAKNAPVILDHLCDECAQHFSGLRASLDEMHLSYTVNPFIVRGLDYYTKTVFEFVSQNIGAQGTVCGGGRYDGLLSELGGTPTPALGFAIGLERLLMLMENTGVSFPAPQPCQVFIASLGETASRRALALTTLLREEGFFAECDIVSRGLKAQMKYADKIGASFVIVLGEEELSAGHAVLKRMSTGETTPIDLGDGFLPGIYDAVRSLAVQDAADAAAAHLVR